MLSGVIPRAEETAGTAVLRIVVSSDSMKNANATSHGRRRLAAFDGSDEEDGLITGVDGLMGEDIEDSFLFLC
jgi:hypothetical protein